MNRKICILMPLVIFIIINSCERKFGDYYDPPKEMEAEIYTQLSTNPELSVFVSAIDLVPGLKEELSSSGLYTVMAPSNDAFTKYFSNHPKYNSLNDIPEKELDAIVKFHIMKWMFFSYQFIDSEFFKFETRSSVPYEVQPYIGTKKEIYSPAKMFQVYTPKYIIQNEITNSDYSFIFGPDAKINTQTNMNIMGASVLKTDISAGNGACYVIDRVLEPPLNIAQELDQNSEYNEYNRLIQRNFVSFAYNTAATRARCPNGDCDGDGMVDSLWTRNYRFHQYAPMLDIENPQTIARGVTTYHMYTAYIPSKQAFIDYLNRKLIPKFGREDLIPLNTLALLYQSHLSNQMDWPSRIEKNRVVNSLGDNVEISLSDIVSAKISSNGLFYQLNKVIEPKAFTHVTGPAFFSTQYRYFAEMLVLSNSLTSLVSDEMKYTIFAPTDEAFEEQNIFYLSSPPAGRAPGFFRYADGNPEPQQISNADVNFILGNHILVNESVNTSTLTNGFYPAQNGSFVVIEDGQIFASERDSVIIIIDDQKDQLMSNGYFHGINKMLIPPQYSIYNQINRAISPFTQTDVYTNVQYYKFKELCSAANLLRIDFTGPDGIPGPVTSLASGKKFTLFIPSNKAIIDAQNAGLLPKTGEENTDNDPITDEDRTKLANWIRYFFVGNQQIFTDGRTTGTFETRYPDIINSRPQKEVCLNMKVDYVSGVLTVTSSENEIGRVLMSDPAGTPQNMICRDGIIHVIDNVFIDLYK